MKSGLAAARARGKKLGRQPSQRSKSDRLAPKVLHAVEGGQSYRWIARDLGISKNTVRSAVDVASTGAWDTMQSVSAISVEEGP